MPTRALSLTVTLGLALIAGCADKQTSEREVSAITHRDWAQWAHSPEHRGEVDVVGQNVDRIITELLVDPHAQAKKAESRGNLLTHYQVPLVVDQDVLMAVQSGSFVPCSPPGSGQPAPCGARARDRQIWSQKMFRWMGDELRQIWTFTSDWKPVPDAGALGGWEPVFHAALQGDFAYVPSAGGQVSKLRRADGSRETLLNPFGDTRGDRFVSGPVTVDSRGNIYWNVLELDLEGAGGPWQNDVRGAWLVRAAPSGEIERASYSSLVPGAPAADAACTTEFSVAELPWPPGFNARPPTRPCGSQRPGVNVSPAVAGDGTIFTVSRAHLNSRYGYVVAVNSDLTPRWAASLRDRLSDGCGSALMPANGSPGGCRAGARAGVDPATNERPAGRVIDSSSATPTITPDGSVLYGSYTRYNGARGHLMKFSPTGRFLASYDFGWDTTPAIYTHDGSYSIVIKDNNYGAGSYCNIASQCPRQPEGPYDITQLSANLTVEWTCTNRNTQACQRLADGSMSCVEHGPGGFEWCINAPVVDANGLVYANAEDGFLYVMEQGGRMRQRVFLDVALGAAYTPVSLGRDGRVYTQNNGRLFVAGQ